MEKPWALITARPIPATKAAKSTAANAVPAVSALKPYALRALMTKLNTIYDNENMKRNYELHGFNS